MLMVPCQLFKNGQTGGLLQVLVSKPANNGLTRRQLSVFMLAGLTLGFPLAALGLIPHVSLRHSLKSYSILEVCFL